ncbi:MAG: DNA-binding response regulator, NarL/FixJ family, contains and domain [Nocardioides sp.]|nr:DNA-binding response regulator, NarL/FixJ family, contains and domain [Nocardioides sp.]
MRRAEAPALRTVVAGDQTLVVEAVGNALRLHGLDALTMVLPLGGPRDVTAYECRAERELEAGVLISSLETPSDLVAIGRLARISVPWVVVTSAPRGPWWGAALLVGAAVVVDDRTSVAALTATVNHLITGRGGAEPQVSGELDSVWQVAREEHAAALARAAALGPQEQGQLALLCAGAETSVDELLLRALGIACSDHPRAPGLDPMAPSDRDREWSPADVVRQTDRRDLGGDFELRQD